MTNRPGRRKCRHCGVRKPIVDFHIRWVDKKPRGFRTYCKSCMRLRLTARRYGIKPVDLEILYEAQQGRCAICKCKADLHVDHDHRIGVIRGLLCNSCNNGLGRFKDNPKFLISAAKYLKKTRER